LSITQLHPASGAAMKAFEDGLDALVCAIAGIAHFTGEVEAHGDEDAAIWLPSGCRDYAGRSDRFAAFI
jgi:predicted RNase H-like nuclease